jgi:molybdenum cofactor sulfurtransferase
MNQFNFCDQKTIAALSTSNVNASPPSLLVLTGLSNITNSKTPLSLSTFAKQAGYNVVLDAAALAPTSRISLRSLGAKGVDAMAISFYKMFGYPTGVGALIVKKDFLSWLSGGRRNELDKDLALQHLCGGNRVWFAGGTVDVVQVPGKNYTLSPELHERFEVGN